MNIIKKLLPFWNKDLSQNDKAEVMQKAMAFAMAVDGVQVNTFSEDESYLRAASEKLWAAYRACHLVGNVLVNTDYHLTKRVGLSYEKVEDPKEVQSIVNLISNPNEWDTFEDMLYLLVFHLKLTGKGYWLKEDLGADGVPAKLFTLYPQFVIPIASTSSLISSYEYRFGGMAVKFAVEDVIRFNKPSCLRPLSSQSDLMASQEVAKVYMAVQDLAKKYLTRGAHPSGVLTREDVVDDPVAWQAMKDTFEALYAGSKNVGKTAFLNGKWNFHKLGLSLPELVNIEAEKWSVQQILLSMGVPLSVAGLDASANYATARTDELNFRKYECLSQTTLIVSKLNSPYNGLLSASQRFGKGNIKIDYSMNGLIDLEAVNKECEPMVRNGAMTPNEWRVKAGLSPVADPALDEYYVTNSLVPLSMSGMTGNRLPDQVPPMVKPTT